jgi:phosphate starvation-inducible protein PhoH and related proteins
VQQRRKGGRSGAPAPLRVDDVDGVVTSLQRQIAKQACSGHRPDPDRVEPSPSRQRRGQPRAEATLLVVEQGQRIVRHGLTVASAPRLRRVQDVVVVSNEVAAELAGVGDGVLDSLRERLGCSISLRGNQLTLDGDAEHVGEARAVVDELVELVEGGHQIGPDTVGAVLTALDQAADIRDVFEDVVWRHRGKKIAPKTVMQKRYVDEIRRCTVTFAIGPAGTGKTYLAIALAVAALQERQVGRIILTRPAVEAGERLGFLPGDVLAKVDPYMRPLFDALYDTMDPDRLNAYIDRGTIEVAPLAFMRGRTLNDSFVILDEAQNTTPEQMQMFLTRLGFGSKMVVTGDVTQIDLPREQASGLIQVRQILGIIDGIAFVEFTHEDVVRHKLVQRIVEAYKRHAEETGSARNR